GWIISQIEEYFSNLGYFFKIFAVSPKVENIWPADEIIYLEYEGNLKFFGLQFKRPNLTTSKTDLSKVNWDFSDSRQFSYIQNNNNIIYALPTFLNNEYKHISLEHCAFWKPKDTKYNSVFNYNEIIYDLKNKETKEAIRWGQLMELILSCN